MSQERREGMPVQPPGQDGGQFDVNPEPIGEPDRPSPAADGGERTRNTQRLLGVLAVASIITIVFDVVLSIQEGIWQPLVAVGCVGAALLLIPVAGRLVRRGELESAGYLVLFGITFVLLGNELILLGATPYLAVGGILLLTLAGYISLPESKGVWLVALLVLGGGMLLINYLEPLPRYAVASQGAVSIFVPMMVAFLVLGALWQVAHTFRVGTIRARLILMFVAIALVPTMIILFSSLYGGVSSGRRRTQEQLHSIAVLKASEVESWTESLQLGLAFALADDEAQWRATLLLRRQEASDSAMGYGVKNHFDQVIEEVGVFETLFLMDPEGKVLLSTNPSEEGRLYGDQEFFQEGSQGAYVQPPAFSVSLGKMAVVAARPVVDFDGNRVGVLAGLADLDALERIMTREVGLGETTETYLVGADHVLLTPNRFGETGIYVRTPGAERAIQGVSSGTGLYLNYRGRPVIASYHWLPKLKVALLAEQEQAEAFQATYLMLGLIGGLGLLSVILAVGAALLTARGIADPLDHLAKTATSIASGDLDQKLAVERQDEIGAVARAFNSMTAQLRSLILSLEQRVADRTRELERRSAYLEAGAEVGRAAVSILDPEALMQQTVERICAQFGFYYVALFLVEGEGGWAVLHANAGQTERPLPKLGQRLRVGGGSMIGWSIANREARVALEASEDTIRMEQPELPETRSEAAIPLHSRGEVIGAISVQHTEPGAFDQDMVVVLQTMADQVAAALDNARLFAEREAALESAQRAYGEMSREAWLQLLQTQPHLGYRSDERGVAQAGDLWRPEMREALEQGQTVRSNGLGPGDRRTLAVPIKVRGETVGVLDTYKPAEAGDWTEEEVALLEAIAGQLDSALESARLYQDTQRRAAREQAIRRVTEQMRRAVDVEAILQNTVTELARAMGAPRAYVRLGTEAEFRAGPGAEPAPEGEGGPPARETGPGEAGS